MAFFLHELKRYGGLKIVFEKIVCYKYHTPVICLHELCQYVVLNLVSLKTACCSRCISSRIFFLHEQLQYGYLRMSFGKTVSYKFHIEMVFCLSLKLFGNQLLDWFLVDLLSLQFLLSQCPLIRISEVISCEESENVSKILEISTIYRMRATITRSWLETALEY